MEELEHAFWRSVGASVIMGEGEGAISWPRAASSCEYAMPAYFEDELELALTVGKIGTRSVTYGTEFRRGGERIASGKTTAVCCTMHLGRFDAAAIPDAIRRKLEVFSEV